MKKTVSIIICNLLLLCLIIGICEVAIYKYQAKIFYDTHPKIFPINKFSYDIYFPTYLTDLKNYFNGQSNIFYGRKPDGLEYKNKTPITIFGCSFAFGQHLDFNKTLSYKLAHKLKRPVHNRAISGGSFQHMYMQATNTTLYEDIPNTDTVIYIMIDDHYRRMMLNYFEILDSYILPHYSKKNNKLVMDDYNNKFTNVIKSSYIVKTINHIYTNNYINNPKNADKITDTALLYFTESRKEMEKHWGNNLKFVVIFYDSWNIPYKKLLSEKLKKNGFIVFSTNDITNENLKIEKYMMQDNNHPTEKAWDLLTPKIAERLQS